MARDHRHQPGGGKNPPLARASHELIERVKANVPPELLADLRWVAWDRTPRASDGRPSKKPIDPRTGGDAKSNDQTTWASSADASEAALRIDRAGGVGFALAGGEWIVADLDHVIDRQSGEIAPSARDLLATLSPSYTELSPGGDGLHVWLRGRKPDGWRNQVNDAFGPGTKLEVYDGSDARYFTITGSVWQDEPIADATDGDLNVLGRFMARQSPPPPRSPKPDDRARQGDSDDLTRASYVLERVLPNPDDYPYDDWLRLVAACCSLGEPGRQIAETWCRRGPKYDPRTDATERQAAGFDGSITIATLFAEADRVRPGWRGEYAEQAPGRPDHFTSAKPESPNAAKDTDGGQTFVDAVSSSLAKGLLSKPPPPRAYLLRYPTRDGLPVPPGGVGDGFAPAGVAGLLFAEGGAGKTVLLMMLGVCAITGREWMGFRVDPDHVGRRVLLVLIEESDEEVHRRLWAIADHLDLDVNERRAVEDRLAVFALAGTDYPTQLAVVDAEGRPGATASLRRLLEIVRGADEPWGLIAIDPLARAFPDAETSNAAATFAVQSVERLVRAPGRPLVMLLHHSSKSARTTGKADSRGVTGLSDAARWALSLTVKGMLVELLQTKSNYSAPMHDPIHLVRDRGGVLRLASTAERTEAAEAAGEAQATQAEDDLRRVILALRGAATRGERPKSKKEVGRLARLSDARAGWAVDRGLSTGEIEKRNERGFGVWFALGDVASRQDGDAVDPERDDGEDSDGGQADDAECVRAVPPTPPGTPERAFPASGRERLPASPSSVERARTPERGTLDDGQPEQPKGKRRKAKARVAVEPERVQPDDADFEHGRGEVQP